MTASVAISSSYALTASFVISASFASTASYVFNAVSASFASTASYALNGGVTQLLAGSNVTLSPTNGLGQVTISSTGGGGSSFNTATGSYGSFYSTQTQTNVAGTARSMSLNVTDITNGVLVSGSTDPYNTYIKTQNAGVYNIQFSAQVDKSDPGADEIWIWLRKNGTNLTETATSIKLTGNADHQVAAWNFFANAAANDYFQLMWYSSDANVRLHAEPAFGEVPGIPSLIVTANRIDQFLSNTGSFSGSFNGSLFGTASWANNATTASYVTSSGVFGPNGANSILSSSFATTASYWSGSTAYAATSSVSISSSFATTASHWSGSTAYAATSSVSISSSYALSSSFALSASWAPGGSSTITIADEGTAQGTATFLNFIGTGVTATVSANTGSITITSGGGSGLTTKAGSVANSSFTGTPNKATVTFTTAFPDTNYAVTITGEDARSWTIESKVVGSFIINSNSNVAPTGTTYWTAIAYGEA